MTSTRLVLVLFLVCLSRAAQADPAGGDAAVRTVDIVATRGGSIVLKVNDFASARAEVLRLARRHGAELREAGSEVNLAGETHGELTLRVDAEKLDSLMDDVRKIGKLYSERVQTTDRTSYYETLQRRADLLKQNEAELQEFLRSPRRMRGSDLLFVQYRLYQTRAQASDAAQESLQLARGSRKSLLNVFLFEPQPKQAFDWKSWHAGAIYRSKGLFLDATRKLITGGYLLVWFAPLWIPAAVLLYLLWRWLRGRFRSWQARREQRYENLPAPQD